MKLLASVFLGTVLCSAQSSYGAPSYSSYGGDYDSGYQQDQYSSGGYSQDLGYGKGPKPLHYGPKKLPQKRNEYGPGYDGYNTKQHKTQGYGGDVYDQTKTQGYSQGDDYYQTSQDYGYGGDGYSKQSKTKGYKTKKQSYGQDYGYGGDDYSKQSYKKQSYGQDYGYGGDDYSKQSYKKQSYGKDYGYGGDDYSKQSSKTKKYSYGKDYGYGSGGYSKQSKTKGYTSKKQSYGQDYGYGGDVYSSDYGYDGTCLISSHEVSACAEHCYSNTAICFDACKASAHAAGKFDLYVTANLDPGCVFTCITKQASCLQACTCVAPGENCTVGAIGKASCCLDNGKDNHGKVLEGCRSTLNAHAASTPTPTPTHTPTPNRCCLPLDGSVCDLGATSNCCRDDGDVFSGAGSCDVGGSGFNNQVGCCVTPGNSCHDGELCCSAKFVNIAATACPSSGTKKNFCCLADNAPCNFGTNLAKNKNQCCSEGFRCTQTDSSLELAGICCNLKDLGQACGANSECCSDNCHNVCINMTTYK